MNNTNVSSQVSVERSLSLLLTDALGTDFEMFSVTVIGKRVILHGNAPSYAYKARANETLRLAGFADVDNRLRVAPGMPYALE